MDRDLVCVDKNLANFPRGRTFPWNFYFIFFLNPNANVPQMMHIVTFIAHCWQIFKKLLSCSINTKIIWLQQEHKTNSCCTCEWCEHDVVNILFIWEIWHYLLAVNIFKFIIILLFGCTEQHGFFLSLLCGQDQIFSADGKIFDSMPSKINSCH